VKSNSKYYQELWLESKSSQKVSKTTELFLTRTRNNLFITLLAPDKRVALFKSLGVIGLKNATKVLNEIKEPLKKTILSIAEKCDSRSIVVSTKGLSSAEIEFLIDFLLEYKFKIEQLRDLSRIPHNGCKAKKNRRL
jgi:ribosomal protein S11